MNIPIFCRHIFVLTLLIPFSIQCISAQNGNPNSTYPRDLSNLEGFINLDGNTKPQGTNSRVSSSFNGLSVSNVEAMQGRVARVVELRGRMMDIALNRAKTRDTDILTVMQNVKGLTLRGYDLTPQMKASLNTTMVSMLNDVLKGGWKTVSVSASGQPYRIHLEKGNSGQFFCYQVLSKNILDAQGKVIGKTPDQLIMINIVGKVQASNLVRIGHAFNIEELVSANF